MAKSNGFFTLRRGSTKSLTFQVINGKQITKDRVSNVANPKSQKQQYQRAIMATVMAAYSAMKSIVDHSFQGKRKGAENQREFMSRNLNKMRAALVSYFESNPNIENQNFVSVAPKVPTILPCAWDISAGSLQKSNFLKYDDSNHTLRIPQVPEGVFKEVSDHLEVNAGELADALGIYEGLQRTFLVVTMGNGLPIYQVYDENGAGYAGYNFGYARYIVGKIDRSQNIVGASADNDVKMISDFIKNVADARTSASLKDITLTETLAGYTCDAEIALASAGFDESLSFAIGEITSHVDEDLRSPGTMICRNWADSKLLGLTYDYILDAWRKADALGESEKYLEGGSI